MCPLADPAGLRECSPFRLGSLLSACHAETIFWASMLQRFPRQLKPPNMHLSEALDFVVHVTFGASSEHLRVPLDMGSALQWASDLGIVGAFASQMSRLGIRWSDPVRTQVEFKGVQQPESLRQANDEALGGRLLRVVPRATDFVLLDASLEQLSRTSTFALVRDPGMPTITAALRSIGFSEQQRNSGPHVQWADAGRHELLLLAAELRFLRAVPGGPFIDLECLKRRGLLIPVKINDGFGVWRPSDAVRVAQIVAQALVEHRFVPGYSFFSALRAVADLGLADNHDLAFDAYTLLQTDVRYAEFDAFRELLRGLVHGELTGLSSPARVLLDHALASARQPLYRVKLSAQRRLQQWQQDGLLERFVDTCEGVAARIRRMR